MKGPYGFGVKMHRQTRWLSYPHLMPHICVSELARHWFRRQALTWPNTDLLSIGTLGTNFSEIGIKHIFYKQKNAFENVACEMVATLCRGRWVKRACSKVRDRFLIMLWLIVFQLHGKHFATFRGELAISLCLTESSITQTVAKIGIQGLFSTFIDQKPSFAGKSQCHYAVSANILWRHMHYL